MKIYVVTDGEYSDYHIITATTDKNIAEAVVKKFADDWHAPKIEIYEDAELCLKPCFFVRFNKDGSVHEIFNESEDQYSYGRIGKCYFDQLKRVLIYVASDSVEGAIKIAAEHRAKFLAETEGL